MHDAIQDCLWIWWHPFFREFDLVGCDNNPVATGRRSSSGRMRQRVSYDIRDPLGEPIIRIEGQTINRPLQGGNVAYSVTAPDGTNLGLIHQPGKRRELGIETSEHSAVLRFQPKTKIWLAVVLRDYVIEDEAGRAVGHVKRQDNGSLVASGRYLLEMNPEAPAELRLLCVAALVPLHRHLQPRN